MKRLLYLQYIVIALTILICGIGYIKAICFFIGAANPFVLLLVVFWGPVVMVSVVYMLTSIFNRINKSIKRQMKLSVYSVAH